MEKRNEWVGLVGIPLILGVSFLLLQMNLSAEYFGVVDLFVRLAVLVGLIVLLRPILTEHWKVFQQKRWTKWVWIILGMLALHAVVIGSRAVFPPVNVELPVEAVDEGVDFLELEWGEFFLVALTALTPVVTAIIEECTFRYLLLGKLLDDQKVKTVALVVANGLLFGLIHYYNVGGFYNTIPYMFAGVLLACVYVKTRNLWMVIGMHVLYNGLLSIIPVLFLGIFRLFA